MREPRQYLETDMLKTEIFAMNSKYSKIVSSKVVKVLLQSTFSVRLQRLSMPEICFVGIEGHRKVSREKAKIQILTSPVLQFCNTLILILILIIIIHNIKIFWSVKYSMTRKIIATFSSCVLLFWFYSCSFWRHYTFASHKENAWDLAWDSTAFFMWILRNFSEHLFYRTLVSQFIRFEEIFRHRTQIPKRFFYK